MGEGWGITYTTLPFESMDSKRNTGVITEVAQLRITIYMKIGVT
jgi:hypothetical protein